MCDFRICVVLFSCVVLVIILCGANSVPVLLKCWLLHLFSNNAEQPDNSRLFLKIAFLRTSRSSEPQFWAGHVNVIYEPCHWFSCFCAFSKVTVNVLGVIVVRKLSPSKLLCLPPHLIDCHL